MLAYIHAKKNCLHVGFREPVGCEDPRLTSSEKGKCRPLASQLKKERKRVTWARAPRRSKEGAVEENQVGLGKRKDCRLDGFAYGAEQVYVPGQTVSKQ